MTYPVKVSQQDYYGYGDAHTVNLPAGATGQSILLFIGSNGNPTMSSAPTGFTLVNSWADTTAAKLFLYYRETDGSEGSTIDFTLSGDFDVSCRLLRFRNLRSGALSNWLEYAQASYTPANYIETPTLASSFTDDEYFIHLGYGFFVGDTALDSYPSSLTDNRDFDAHAGTDADVGSTLASRESLSSYFGWQSWSLTANIEYIALSLVLRGDTLDVVNSDLSADYGLGGWVRADDFVAEWNYPDQPTATLESIYSVFKYAASETTLVEDNFTGTAGSIYSHTPDEGSTWEYGPGGTDTTPPQIDGSGWLKPYGAAAPIYIYQAVSVSSNYYSVEATIKFQGESGASSQYAALVLKDSNGNDRIQCYLSLNSGNLSVDFAAQAVGGSAYHSVDLGDATPLIDNTYTIRVEVTDDILAACFVDGTLVKVLAPPGNIPNPTRLYIDGYDIGETSGDPNFILDHVQFSEGAAGVTSVGQNFSAQWNTKGIVSSDLVVQFKVGLDPVSKDLPCAYSISSFVSKDVVVGYEIGSLKPSLVSFEHLVTHVSGASPASVEIPLPVAGVEGDVLVIFITGGFSGETALDGTSLSGFTFIPNTSTLGNAWARRLDGTETSSVTFPSTNFANIPGRTYHFFGFLFRNLFESATITDWFYIANGGFTGTTGAFNLPQLNFNWQVEYTDWEYGKPYLIVPVFRSYIDNGIPSGFSFDYPVVAERDFYDFYESHNLIVSSFRSIDPEEDYRYNSDAAYLVADADSASYVPTLVLRGLDSVRSDLSTQYDINRYVSRDFVVEYNTRPLLLFPFDVYYGRLSANSFVIEYRLDPKLEVGFDFGYTLAPTVRQGFEVSYTEAVASGFNVGYVLGSKPFVAFDTTNAFYDRVVSAFDAAWFLKSISTGFDVSYGLLRDVENSFSVSFALTARVVNSIDVGFEIRNTNHRRAAFEFGYFISSTSLVSITDTPVVVVDGLVLDVVDAELSTDEEGDVWEASFELDRLDDFAKFEINKEFSILFCSEEYKLIVDSRSIDRSDPASATAKVYGVSPAKIYQAPRAAYLTKTWTVDTAASAIALEMIPTLQWLTIDWIVDANLFGVEKSSPLDVVKRLAEVVGAVFESLPNGTMRVRPKYQVSVPDFAAATSAFFLSDVTDNFSYSEKYVPNKLENLITIMDEQDQQQNDRVEFIQDEVQADRGVIRVYPAIWRNTVSIRPTGSILSYTYNGVVQREEEEEVEFVNGKATLSYPIVDIVSAVWNTTNLGTVGFEFYKAELSCSVADDAYSLLKIRYITQTHNFSIVGTYDTSVQFVVENV